MKAAGLAQPSAVKIVERHGGTLWVESQPGQGAWFKFSLPIQAGDFKGVADGNYRGKWPDGQYSLG